MFVVLVLFSAGVFFFYRDFSLWPTYLPNHLIVSFEKDITRSIALRPDENISFFLIPNLFPIRVRGILCILTYYEYLYEVYLVLFIKKICFSRWRKNSFCLPHARKRYMYSSNIEKNLISLVFRYFPFSPPLNMRRQFLVVIAELLILLVCSRAMQIARCLDVDPKNFPKKVLRG